MKRFSNLLIRIAVAVSLLVLLNGCEGLWLEKAAFGENRFEGQTLRLLVVQKPLTYRRLHQMETGFEYELLQQFAADMGYRLKIQTVRNELALAKELAAGRGDLGAARFSTNSHQIAGFLKSPVYDEDKTALVCRKGTDVDLSPRGKLEKSNRWKLVLNPNTAESSLVYQIRKHAPDLTMVSRPSVSTAPILRSLAHGKGDCTLMDRLEALYYLRVFPKLEIVQDFKPAHSYFFLISKDRPELVPQMRRWISKASRRQIITQAKHRVQGDLQNLSEADIRGFMNARAEVFPRYAALVRKYSESFGIPWQLSAAVAYQESKWDPEAQSFTGVRGFMQLTKETAEHLGVEDRMDIEQSIWGGAKYLKMLLDRQPKELPFRERLALALATYNVGPAHMIDAQNLAQKLGKNPHSWMDLKQVLPLLADKDYWPELKYGPARGQEPVDYVHRVMAYLDLITVQI